MKDMEAYSKAKITHALKEAYKFAEEHHVDDDVLFFLKGYLQIKERIDN